MAARPLQLWRCAAPPEAAANDLPAILLYLLGELGRTPSGTFEFVRDDGDVGEIFVVGEADAAAPQFRGAVGRRNCAVVRPLSWEHGIPTSAGGKHYSRQWCMQKLELLTHLPADVDATVLIDADTYMLRDGSRIFRDQLRLLRADQFLAAPRTDARTVARVNGTSRLVIPHKSEGINSGTLALSATRMRAFAASYCPGRPWWRCVFDAEPLGYNQVGGDQAVWNWLLADHPRVWRQLPCHTHTGIDTLRPAMLRLARAVGAAPCDARLGVTEAHVFPKSLTRNGDSCEAHTSVVVDDARFGDVPREAVPWPGGVAVTHGAARLQPLARLVAALLSATDDAQKRAMLAAFPCWCHGYVRQDGAPAFGAPHGAPRATGCHELSYHMLTGAEPAAPPSSADPSTAPSFPAEDVGCARPPPKAAFCFTGQPRTFIHPEAQRSIVRALKSFGADAYTFFVLTDDDPGSSYHHPSIRSSGDGVRAAMAALRPKYASYAPLEASAAGYANERRVACGMKEEGVTHAIGSRYFMQTFYESHFKLRTCYDEVERYEGTHRFAFDWVVRMRPDVWFWAPMPLPHCRLRQDAVTFPAGVVGCSYAPCINDHICLLYTSPSPRDS